MGNNWAIIVGINNYFHLHPDDHLKYAVNDAKRIQKFLCTQAGFDCNNVVLCSDNSDPVGRYQEIPTFPVRSNLRRILLHEIQRADRVDNLWFFFSGHGRVGKDNHDYLMPSDSYFNDLETAITTDFVIRCLMDCHAKNVVIVLDMCRSFSGSKGIQNLGGSTAKIANQQGITTIFSCQQGEASYEIAELQQGVFTYALMEGLTKFETPRELEKYLQQRVPELNHQYRKPLQIPQISLNSIHKSDLPLLRTTIRQSFSTQLMEILSSETKEEKDTKESINRELIIPSVPGTQHFEFDVVRIDIHGNEINRRREQSQYLIENLNGGMIEMIAIPGGTFLMGSTERKPLNTEIPIHSVTVKPFLISKYPVTKAQWKAVAGLPQVRRRLSKLPSRLGGLNHPITQISWLDAIEFCSRLSEKTGRNYRLPTEAEWEYACRAGTTTPFHFGATITPELANYDGNFPYHSEGKGTNRGKTTQVDNFQFANAFGLFDMHGNVWEWCQDFWHENYENAPLTGEAWLDNDENFSRVTG
ncbi:MAG: SUMF1/EgtB/PvdO family nonheme iron enzyme [Chlorogloeopsis fritschii C42_A2020_084]|uniref:SUMF1/EgtB/PvdO family nonheme iron enzyme n=1 Tax=Chlorogloeopsis fritschii TaxID=1124 RepID=UPI001A030C5C|nr:SUMF1/EgtB/PvdO family nonheme iron enzyme [Chlorogloeopsis fritschii]MBF2004745.1 SUMF1/EgtB/PvdO family nonheme iron enzyme [Chlorogloeopsis fritschii C42_A2020_084]